MIVFITSSNAKKIEMTVDSKKLRTLYIEDLYKLSLWMMSVTEKRWLAAACMFYQNNQFFIENFYNRIDSDASRKSNFVFIDGAPAYHMDSSCEKLRSDYKNFKIPVEILHRGEQEKQKFRTWFSENQQFMDNPTLFINKMSARFMLRNTPHIEEFQKSNSGVSAEDNPSLDDITHRIDTKIAAMEKFRNRHPELINKYGQKTHEVMNGTAKLTDPADAMILEQWHKAKKLLKKDLKTYFKVKFNPDLQFRDDLLQTVGFRVCKSCSRPGHGGVPLSQ